MQCFILKGAPQRSDLPTKKIITHAIQLCNMPVLLFENVKDKINLGLQYSHVV